MAGMAEATEKSGFMDKWRGVFADLAAHTGGDGGIQQDGALGQGATAAPSSNAQAYAPDDAYSGKGGMTQYIGVNDWMYQDFGKQNDGSVAKPIRNIPIPSLEGDTVLHPENAPQGYVEGNGAQQAGSSSLIGRIGEAMHGITESVAGQAQAKNVSQGFGFGNGNASPMTVYVVLSPGACASCMRHGGSTAQPQGDTAQREEAIARIFNSISLPYGWQGNGNDAPAQASTVTDPAEVTEKLGGTQPQAGVPDDASQPAGKPMSAMMAAITALTIGISQPKLQAMKEKIVTERTGLVGAAKKAAENAQAKREAVIDGMRNGVALANGVLGARPEASDLEADAPQYPGS